MELLNTAGLDAKMALEIMTMDGPYRRVRWLADHHLDRFTAQCKTAIDELFRAFGLKNFTTHAANMTGKKLLSKRVWKLVDRRNYIAHEADSSAHGKLRKIDVDEVTRQIVDLNLFIKACDSPADKAL